MSSEDKGSEKSSPRELVEEGFRLHENLKQLLELMALSFDEEIKDALQRKIPEIFRRCAEDGSQYERYISQYENILTLAKKNNKLIEELVNLEPDANQMIIRVEREQALKNAIKKVIAVNENNGVTPPFKIVENEVNSTENKLKERKAFLYDQATETLFNEGKQKIDEWVSLGKKYLDPNGPRDCWKKLKNAYKKAREDREPLSLKALRHEVYAIKNAVVAYKQSDSSDVQQSVVSLHFRPAPPATASNDAEVQNVRRRRGSQGST